MNIKYGKHKETVTTDEHGSTRQTVRTYRGGTATTRHYYEVRVKVNNEAEELSEIIRFMKDKKGSNRTIRTEVPKNSAGSYYVVKCWEE